MIHHVWLINRAGICLVDRDYTGLEVDKQLFTGFLAALTYLADQFHRKLDSLNMGGNMTIYYDLDKKLIIAMAVERDDNEQEIQRKIQELKEVFYLKYSNILEDWDGNISIFDPFVKDLDRILMLDWNYEYDRRIKSKDMKPEYPTKAVINISQRGMDLLESIKEKDSTPED